MSFLKAPRRQVPPVISPGKSSTSPSAWQLPKDRADLMLAIYERITVAGPEIVGVRLTAAAFAHGLALALPDKVVMARPTGVGRANYNLQRPDR